MSSMCYKCENDIEENDKFIECDGCNSLFHLKCANVNLTEAKARKNSKCLKLYCPECFKAKTEGTAEKLKEALALLYKMDCCIQQQKTSTIEQKLAALEAKITANNATQCTQNIVHQTPKPSHATYANVVNKTNVKPTIVIKPKTKQTCAKTIDEISKKINKNDISVCDTRNARDGVVILRCHNKSETLKAKQVVNEKLGSNYDVILPKVKKPRVRISNIATDIPNESIVDELKRNNEQIKDIELKLVTVIPRKIRSVESNDAVFEVCSESFNKLIEISILNMPWRECRVYEHLHVKRCYKCCGYFHKSTECTETQKCSRCAGAHKHSECKSKLSCCVNCKLANEKFNLNLKTNHHAWDKNCPVFQRKLASVRNKIEYNETE